MIPVGRKPKALFVISIAIAVGIVFYLKTPIKEQLNHEITIASKTSSSSTEPELAKANSGDLSENRPQANNRDYGAGALAANWMNRIGKLTNEERADYAHYDEKTLIALSENGDIKAMDVLSDFYISRGIYEDHNHDKAWKYAEKATIYGSIGKISSLAGLALDPPSAIEDGSNQETLSRNKEPHEKLIESIALTQTIALRGDQNLANVMKESYLSQFKTIYDTEVNLSIDDENEINAKAQEYYNSWKSKRAELGLGDFEEMPTSLKKSAELMGYSFK